MTELLSLAEAQARVLERVRPLPGERVELASAAGRFLVEEARAAVDLPPFPSSAMDGGVVPEGADAVIPIEYVVDNDNEIEIPEDVAESANVRPRGGDVRAGDLVV